MITQDEYETHRANLSRQIGEKQAAYDQSVLEGWKNTDIRRELNALHQQRDDLDAHWRASERKRAILADEHQMQSRADALTAAEQDAAMIRREAAAITAGIAELQTHARALGEARERLLRHGLRFATPHERDGLGSVRLLDWSELEKALESVPFALAGQPARAQDVGELVARRLERAMEQVRQILNVHQETVEA